MTVSVQVPCEKADNKPDAGVNEATSMLAATTGNLFRYDATSGQYIFNLSTKSGYTNANGTTRSVNMQLVK
jgi:hypothetical protein